MNDIDFDKNKFDKDSHGNLIPKDGFEAGETHGKDIIPDVEPDVEIQSEYGLEDELPAPWNCSVSCLDCKDQRRCNETIHKPHRSK